MAKLIIEQELAQQIIDYLQTRPYIEVFHLISKMAQMRLSPLDLKEEQPAVPDKKEIRPNETPE